MATFTKGQRVAVSGIGRTNGWGECTGTVVRARSKRVFVHWDNTHFEDEMEPNELLAL